MAANVALGKVTLFDNWPGPINPNLGVPTGGWCGTTHSCITTRAYQPGDKIMAYSDASINPGWYTMYYGQIGCYSTANTSKAGAPLGDVSLMTLFCGHCCLTTDVDDSTYRVETFDSSCAPPRYVLMGCTSTAYGTDLTMGGPLAVACQTMNAFHWGWFWVGGVCPVEDVTAFQGALSTTRGADISINLDLKNRSMTVIEISESQPIISTSTDITEQFQAAGFVDMTNSA